MADAIEESRYARFALRCSNFAERWFSDMRTDRLEKLVLMPIEEPMELANLLPLVEEKLAATDFYPPLFEAAFGTPEVTRERISTALARLFSISLVLTIRLLPKKWQRTRMSAPCIQSSRI